MHRMFKCEKSFLRKLYSKQKQKLCSSLKNLKSWMTLEENLRPIRDQRQNPTQCNLNKQLLRKFAKENSINLLSLKFNVDHKRIAECVNNSN